MSALDVRAIDVGGARAAARPAATQELAVFLSIAAFDRVVERGHGDTSREVGGVLVGELLHDERGPYLRIDATIDALHAEEKGAELTFTHATWDHINREMDTAHQGKRILGWYHTHPGFGVFLSDRDQFIHRSFFDQPFQVAFVYDPKSKEHGLFTWRDDEAWRARRYVIGDREHLWDGDRAVAPPPPASEPSASERDDASDASGGWFGLLTIGMTCALLAGVLGHCLGSSAANGQLVQAHVEVARARGEGAQAAVSTLQHDLVGVLRDTLGDQAMRRPVEQALAELDATLMFLPPARGDLVRTAARARLQQARDAFARLLADRGSAAATLAALEQASRRTAELRTDLAADVAEQRAGLGALYAELAADVAQAGDPDRARRLLATAARLDPANRRRYERTPDE